MYLTVTGILFFSPQGQKMAFYNTKYSDIRIVKIPTMEVVVDTFYSNKKENVYAHHANFSTYVPTYMTYDYIRSDGELDSLVDIDSEFEEDPEAYMKENREKGLRYEIKSLPLAFNAWTIWACDYEFYVDVIDLSEVDNGIIRKSTCPGFTMTRSGKEVRNYIQTSISYWYSVIDNKIDTTTKESNLIASFEYLERIERDRYYVSSKGFGDNHKTTYEADSLLPWEKTRNLLNKRS